VDNLERKSQGPPALVEKRDARLLGCVEDVALVPDPDRLILWEQIKLM
jgi:hypothetical protein